MITPSRWMNKIGIGLKTDWVNDLLRCNHFIKIEDYLSASECFPGVEIKGGVNYFLYAESYNSECEYILHQDGTTFKRFEKLDNGTGIIIRDCMAGEILEKVLNEKEPRFSSLVGPLHFFDRDEQLGSNWKGYKQKYDSVHSIKCYINKQMDSRGYGWVKLSDIPKGHLAIPLHKIFIPKAGGSGNDSTIIGKPFYGEPNSVCSFTYIPIGFDSKKHNFTKEQCGNIISYMKTKFFRYLVSIKKKTQDVSSAVFDFVPIQDWSKLWTDEELYKKYNLSADEISYIESRIKPMGQEELFDENSLIDPEFANFDLSECGVKAGDTIIYTPTNAELTVLEDNQVEYGGEAMSLAVFTAGNMPRNRRSKSGVCQGPKYFSYNGTSLYELRRMFSTDKEK